MALFALHKNNHSPIKNHQTPEDDERLPVLQGYLAAHDFMQYRQYGAKYTANLTIPKRLAKTAFKRFIAMILLMVLATSLPQERLPASKASSLKYATRTSASISLSLAIMSSVRSSLCLLPSF